VQVWIRKLERNLQDYGFKTTLGKFLAHLGKFAYEHTCYRLYRIDFGKRSTEAPSDLEGVTFRFLCCNDEDGIQQIEQNSEWLTGQVRKRLEQGAICLAAFEGDLLAGFNLVSFGDVYMPLVHLSRRFRPDEAWSEQIVAVKTFRKKGMGSQLRYRVFEELRRRGIRKFYGGALSDNMPSLKLAQRVGFQEFVEIRYTRIFRLQRWRYLRIYAAT
jgi:GNAT superfamily N-acetyltransferase